MLDTLYNGFAGLVGTLNDLMYSYVLIILLLAAGVYFTIRTAGVQVRLLGESARGQRKIGRDQGGQRV